MNIIQDSRGWWVVTNYDTRTRRFGPYQSKPALKLTNHIIPHYQFAIIDIGSEGVLDVYSPRFGPISTVWYESIDKILPF
jgi:hypothetical protein